MGGRRTHDGRDRRRNGPSVFAMSSWKAKTATYAACEDYSGPPRGSANTPQVTREEACAGLKLRRHGPMNSPPICARCRILFVHVPSTTGAGRRWAHLSHRSADMALQRLAESSVAPPAVQSGPTPPDGSRCRCGCLRESLPMALIEMAQPQRQKRRPLTPLNLIARRGEGGDSSHCPPQWRPYTAMRPGPPLGSSGSG